jgi:hypothetical protein
MKAAVAGANVVNAVSSSATQAIHMDTLLVSVISSAGVDEPEPKKGIRADRPTTEGFVTIVDGHFKREFDTVEAAETSGRELKSADPRLQIEIYDAANKVRTLLS